MAKSSIYTIGGTVQANQQGVYISRHADTELLHLCQEATFAYVLTPRQMGKSSLMIRTAEQLIAAGIQPVIIDLTQLGTQITAEEWYSDFLDLVAEQLMLNINVKQWWQAHDQSGITLRLTRFFQEVVLTEVSAPVVIFVDEIDTTLSLDFTDDFYAAIRYLYIARPTHAEFHRLSFVLIGVATPADLIRDPKRTPFNIGQRVDLTDFTTEEALPLEKGLGLLPGTAQQVLHWIMEWTGGHPYLTQRLCSVLANQQDSHWSKSKIKQVVKETFLGSVSHRDNNLQFVQDMLTRRSPNVGAELMIYRDIWWNKRVEDEEQSILKTHLKLSGVVKRDGTALKVRNLIYHHVFDASWVQEHLPETWWDRIKPAMPLITMMAVFSVAMAGLSWYAFSQRNEARRQVEISLAQQLSERAQILQGHDTEDVRSMLVAIEASRRLQALGKSNETANAVLQTVLLRVPRLKGPPIHHQKDVYDLAWSRNGKYLATASEDKTAHLMEVATGRTSKPIVHQGKVYSVAFSPDSKYLATGSEDKTARLIATATGNTLLQIPHQGKVNAVAFSPDGRYLATASEDRVVRLIAPTSGRILRRFPQQAEVSTLAFSPNGKYFVTTGKDKAVRLIELATGKELMHRFYHTKVVSAIFSPNGKSLAVASWEGIAHLIETATGKPRLKIPVDGGIRSLAFSPDNKYLAIGALGGDCSIHLIQIATGKRLARIHLSGWVGQITWAPNSKYLAVAAGATDVFLLEIPTGQTLARIPEAMGPISFSPNGQYLAANVPAPNWKNYTVRLFETAISKPLAGVVHQGAIYDLKFSPDGNYLVTASDDKTVRVSKTTSGQALLRIPNRGMVYQVEFSSNGNYLATTSTDNTVRLIALPSGKTVAQIPHQGLILSTTFSPNGNYLATASTDYIARLIETRTGKVQLRIPHRGVVYKVAFSPNNQYLAAASEDKKATLVEIDTRRIVTRVSHPEPVWFIAFSPDSKYLVTLSEDKAMRLIEAATGKVVKQIQHPDQVGLAVFSPDGKSLATISQDKVVRLIDQATGKILFAIPHEGWIRQHMIFSPNGKLLVTDSDDRSIRIIEVATGKVLHRISFNGWNEQMIFSPDGKYLATANSDQAAHLIEVVTGNSLARLPHAGEVGSVAFSPDGKYLATGSNDGTAHISLINTIISTEALIAEACQRLPRNFTRAEWKRYLGDETYRQTCPNLPSDP